MSTTRQQGAIRREADQIEAAVGRGRFRRRRKLETTPHGERLVLAAVARAKEGDADALRYLYLRYADNVYGYVCSIVRDEYEAEDVTQQIFAKLLTALARYEPRVVLVLRFLVGLSPGEIAERMGRSEDAVHGLQHRGRRRLRSEMLALAA